MADFWNLGNTTVRNPERIPGALRVFDKYYDEKKTFKENKKQQGEFFEKLLNHKDDGNKVNESDPTEIPIYNSLEKKLSMNQDAYNQKNGRMYLSAMNDFGIISAYDLKSRVTAPGKAYLTHPELQGDIWLRQLLKFQIPNHEKKIKDICIRPAYVILKLMLEFDGLTKFELGLVNLTKSEDLTKIKRLIQNYRNARPQAEKTNKVTQLKEQYASKQIAEYFLDEFNERLMKLKKIITNVKSGKAISGMNILLDEVVGLGKGPNTPRAKETKQDIISLLKNKDYEATKFTKILEIYFLLVKSTTIWGDYVDLNPRYLKMCRMLGWLNKEQKGESRFIVLEEYEELVKLAINSLGPIPQVENQKEKEDFKTYLQNVNEPILKIDEPVFLKKEILEMKKQLTLLNSNIQFDDVTSQIVSDERLLYNKLFQHLQKEKEIEFIKKIDKKEIEKELIELQQYPKKITPTHLESLIWKSILSLGGTKAHPSESRNFHVDSEYESIFTAAGEMPDMQFYYNSFDEIVEVTKSEGKTQWKMEHEPVPRHVASHKFFNKKETSCIFIAPSIDKETQERFFMHSKKILSEIIKENEVFVSILPLTFLQFQKIYSHCISNNNPEQIWMKILIEFHLLISNSKDLQEWNDNIVKYIGNLK